MNPFLASPTEELRTKMNAQRLITDQAFAAIRDGAADANLTDPKTIELVRAVESRSKVLAESRRKVDDRKTNRSEMGAVLQDITNVSKDLVGRLGGQIEDALIARLVLALHAALEVATGSLNEGGRGEIAFKDKALSMDLYRVMHRGVEIQNAFGKQLDIFGPVIP